MHLLLWGAGWPPAHHTGSEHVLSFSEMSEDVFNTFPMGIVQWWIPIWKRKWHSGHFFFIKKVARWMILFSDMKLYFHFLLSSHGWSSEGLPTIEELTVSQATPEKKSTDKSPSRIQDLLSGDALPIILKHVTIQTLPFPGWKRKPCPNLLISYASFTVGGGGRLAPCTSHWVWTCPKFFWNVWRCV